MSEREARFFAHLDELRAKNPMLGDSYWAAVAEKQRLQWKIDDLGGGIARLAGKYGFHVTQDPGNARLAALVDELLELNRTVFDTDAAEGVAR